MSPKRRPNWRRLLMALPLLIRSTVPLGKALVTVIGVFTRRGIKYPAESNVYVEIRADIEGEVIRLDKLNKTHQRIIARSLNKAVAKARTQTARELSQAKGLPQKVLKRRIQGYKATPNRPKAALWVGTRKAITAKELGGGLGSTAGGHVKVGRRVFKSAFRATMPSGHTGIFTRKPTATHRRRPDGQNTQLSIEESVVQLMPEARDISKNAAEFHLKRTFPQEVRRLARLAIEMQQF